MNHKLANAMKIWKGNGNTTTLLFSLKGLEILHQERRGQVKTIVMEHFTGILFHKSRPANKQHTNQFLYSGQSEQQLLHYGGFRARGTSPPSGNSTFHISAEQYLATCGEDCAFLLQRMMVWDMVGQLLARHVLQQPLLMLSGLLNKLCGGRFPRNISRSSLIPCHEAERIWLQFMDGSHHTEISGSQIM